MIRSLKALPGHNCSNEAKIMSYNVLAQALVRRDQYPTSGRFLRWGHRSQVFIRELNAYDPDVLLLQEVDNDNRKFWIQILEKQGYHCIFYSHASKKHGLAICYKTEKYIIGDQHRIDLDSIEIDGIERQCDTTNVALFITLNCKSCGGCEPHAAGAVAASRNLLVGTAHFYWHPDASYERCRQFLCIFNQIERIKKNSIVIFGGDCNTEHFDPAYLLATASLYGASTRAALIMQASTNATIFQRFGAVQLEDGKAIARADDKSPANPSLLKRGDAAAAAMEAAFRAQPLVATSFYSKYGLIADNAAECGEPLYTNWTDVFKGTLDYIFCVHEKNADCPLVVTKLLEIPTPEEIGPSGLPKSSVGPSDHFCLMAQVAEAN